MATDKRLVAFGTAANFVRAVQDTGARQGGKGGLVCGADEGNMACLNDRVSLTNWLPDISGLGEASVLTHIQVPIGFDHLDGMSRNSTND